MLFAVAAPSGAGKTSIVKEILFKNPDFVFSVSATTRKKRNIEIDGKDYFFLSKEDFESRIANKELVEYEKLFDDNYYGTLKSYVDENLRQGKNVVFDIDVNGALSLKRIYGEKAVLIFVKPPDKNAVLNRLRGRGTETEEQICKRLDRYDMEIEKINEFDYIVENNNLQTAVEKVQEIVLKHRI